DRRQRHVVEARDEGRHLGESHIVQVSSGSDAGEMVTHGVGQSVANQQKARHPSQCATNASICFSVSSKSPRKHIARSSTNTWAAGFRSSTPLKSTPTIRASRFVMVVFWHVTGHAPPLHHIDVDTRPARRGR